MAIQFDQTQHFYLPPNTYTNTTNGIYAKTAPIYYCPSDRTGALWQGDPYWRSRGSYVVSWGPQAVPYNSGDPTQTLGLGTGIFGYVDGVSGSNPRNPRLADITDGTSNTLLLSGTLAGGPALVNKAAALDHPVGKGHVVMFAIRPFWRWQTQGTYTLGFNAIMNWNDLDAGKAVPGARGATQQQ